MDPQAGEIGRDGFSAGVANVPEKSREKATSNTFADELFPNIAITLLALSRPFSSR
jgi:hypothetical protein